MASLFEETTINGMVMSNRMIRSATWEGMCEQDGRPTEKLINCNRDLAGMTNCDTISGERGLRDAIHPRAKHGPFWQSS